MLEIGSLLDGKYKILNKIGQGGMSIVYLAMNEKANKQWAVKEMRKEKNRNYEVMKQSLITETNLLKELKHPYLPSIADIIENDDTIIIVMDYVEGRPLSDILLEEGTIEEDKVVDYAIQLCDVLDYLHSQNPPIIYRDLKPANIMLKPDGKITLIDFGTARKYNYDSVSDTTCLGTIGYAAPEQFAGETLRQTDARTDIYNLGATMYHLLTGVNPSEPPYELYPIRRWDERLSNGLEKIILRATRKDPEKRFNDCKEMSYALQHFRDLDDSYIATQKKKILMFAASLILSFTFFSMAIVVNGMEKREISKVYNNYLSEAALTIASSGSENVVDANVLKLFQDAINISPQSTEAYVRMLDYYCDLGQTRNGLMAISAMIAVIGGNLVLDNIMTLGTIVSITQLVDSLTRPLMNMASQITTLTKAIAGAERIFNILDIEEEIDEGTIDILTKNGIDYWYDTTKTDTNNGIITKVEASVIIEDLYFKYDKSSENYVLKNISVHATKGEQIAFVGATGAGKTTITNLINRFYEIDKGRITIDGIDIKDIKKNTLRRTITTVLQDTVLFSTTILENIRYGRLDATDEEVYEAAKIANVDKIIENLPDGYNTKISATDVSLSQGQIQLISIARAVLANSKIIILDEATSSIDTRTEQLVQNAMDNLMTDKTTFVIAHRLSTIRNSKAIILLDNGKIIERRRT